MYKDIFQNRKAVCFDLDGTIVDTHPIWLYAHRVVLQEIGIPSYVDPSDYCTPGKSLEETWEKFLQGSDLKNKYTAKDLTDKTNSAFIDTLDRVALEPRDGFWTLAAKVKQDLNLKLGLVTNSAKIAAEKVLTKIGFDKSIDARVYGDDVKKLKPDPEMYKKIATQLGATPKEIVVFEDSITGATAAAKANMDLVIINDDELFNVNKFPGNVVFYYRDFSYLADNMEITYKEHWENIIDEITEKITT